MQYVTAVTHRSYMWAKSCVWKQKCRKCHWLSCYSNKSCGWSFLFGWMMLIVVVPVQHKPAASSHYFYWLQVIKFHYFIICIALPCCCSKFIVFNYRVENKKGRSISLHTSFSSYYAGLHMYVCMYEVVVVVVPTLQLIKLMK